MTRNIVAAFFSHTIHNMEFFEKWHCGDPSQEVNDTNRPNVVDYVCSKYLSQRVALYGGLD